MNRIDRIRTALKERFAPSRVEVVDESGRHAGHAGAVPGEVTHVRVEIEAAAFDGKTPVEMHRAINEALRAEFDSGLHALSIQASGTSRG